MHFSVLAIVDTPNIYDELEPYSEEYEVEPYLIRTRKEILEDSKARQKQLKLDIKEKPDYKLNKWEKQLLDATTDEEFLEAGKEDYYQYDEEGNEYGSFNPDAFYDWFTVGGRFTDKIVFKNGERGDWGKFKDIDFRGDDEVYYEALHFWTEYVDKEKTEDYPYSPPPKYFLDKYGTKEKYARSQSTFCTYGVLKNGEYVEMPYEEDETWTNSFYENFLSDVSPDTYLFVVDCHI